MSANPSSLPQPHTVYLNESEFMRLGDIFRAAGIQVELVRPYPPLPDTESPRERYRRATIERANADMEQLRIATEHQCPAPAVGRETPAAGEDGEA